MFKRGSLLTLLLILSVVLLVLLDSWLPHTAAASAPRMQAPDEPPTVVTLENGYRITFLGVTYNTHDGTSTWRYRVEELSSAQDLSNWMLELYDCHDVITATPESWWLEYPDPNSGLNGIKWQGAGIHGSAEFSVTLAGYWVVGTNQVAAKGPDVALGLLAGPSCSQNFFDVGKTVTPDVAQPGDVLTYTLTLTNVTHMHLSGIVATDAIPAGTTYVNGSLHVSAGYAEYDATGNLITWEGDLGPGAVVNVTFNVYVHDDIAAGSTITNTVHANYYEYEQEHALATTLIEAADDPAWVLLVYLSADNNLDNETHRIIRDQEAFNALEEAAFHNPRLRIYVQWDRSTDYDGHAPDEHTRRYRVRPDLNPFGLAVYTAGVDTWHLEEVNMGDPASLSEFIGWAQGYYSSTYEALSIIGHGGGWSPTFQAASDEAQHLSSGIAWDDRSTDYLSTKELGEALYLATNEQADPFDVLFFDASMMAMLENAYEVRDSARYLVAAQGNVWARFAYDQYLKNTNVTTTPEAFAEKIVTKYAASLHGYPVTMGAIAVDLASLTPLVDAVDHLAVALTESLTETRSAAVHAYTATQKFDSNWDMELQAPDAYVDLYDFAHELKQLAPVSATAVHSSALAVMSAWDSAVVMETHHTGHPWLEPSVTWGYTDAHGLSIYLPLGEDSWVRDHYTGTQLALAQDTQWDEFIRDSWYEGEPAPPLSETMLAQDENTLAPTLQAVDPAQRPGLFTPQRFFVFLPVLHR